MARRRFNDYLKMQNKLVCAGMKQKKIKEIVLIIKQHYDMIKTRESQEAEVLDQSILIQSPE